jgi:hypothetical protein
MKKESLEKAIKSGEEEEEDEDNDEKEKDEMIELTTKK